MNRCDDRADPLLATDLEENAQSWLRMPGLVADKEPNAPDQHGYTQIKVKRLSPLSSQRRVKGFLPQMDADDRQKI